jgi:hypothetical protein
MNIFGSGNINYMSYILCILYYASTREQKYRYDNGKIPSDREKVILSYRDDDHDDDDDDDNYDYDDNDFVVINTNQLMNRTHITLHREMKYWPYVQASRQKVLPSKITNCHRKRLS